MVEYKAQDVLTAARERISWVFDRFEDVVVSVSSGKDSTVLFWLAVQEAERRGRKVEAFFLDQEAEYASSIRIIEQLMSHPAVIPRWYQVPVRMTNATSHKDYFLRAWEPGANWVHPKHPVAIHAVEGPYPDRFYEFFPWFEGNRTRPTAFLIGLRSKESLVRFRATTTQPGIPGVAWSTRTSHPESYRLYPIYDWTFGDVWKFIADNEIPYNRVYDWMFARHGANASTMRISNLIHEKSFRALVDLQEFEPDTWERLVARIGGVHCASIYYGESGVFDVGALPTAHATWQAYRDYLLDTTPIDRAGSFRKRFAKQRTDEATCREQVRQILCNDWENNLSVRAGMAESVKKVWMGRL